MELEQIIKKVDWLDDERRKDKDRISKLEERLIALEGNAGPMYGKLKDHDSDLAPMSAQFARMSAYDESLLQIRVEMKQQFDDIGLRSDRGSSLMKGHRWSELTCDLEATRNGPDQAGGPRILHQT